MTVVESHTERDRIIAAARDLVEEGGPDALTMRKLAAELGVAHTAIYWHVGSREDVLCAVVDSFLADAGEIKPRGRTPRARIASIARQVHRQAVAHPALVSLTIEHGRAGALWNPAHVLVGNEVAATGLKGAAARKAVMTILYLSGAFVTLEASLEETAYTHASIDLARAVFEDALDAVLDKITGG